MRILLVNPKRVGRGQASVRLMSFTPLALPTLKALTPDDVEVRIVDENLEAIPYDEHWDLVGITVMLHVAPSAREIAKRFHRQRTKVALGGFFPSLWPDDISTHVDTVVAGEAERVWKDLVRDLKRRQLKPLYKAEQFADLSEIPLIRRDDYTEHEHGCYVESTRGCPHNCDFCSVTALYGRQLRHRPVEHVVQQLEELEGTLIHFADDNITADRKYARQLFAEIAPLKARWTAQFTIHHAEDRDLLALAAESGCVLLFTGFESLNPQSLRSVNKSWTRPDKFEEWIRAIHEAGIAVYASFMFGFEEDDPDVFKRTLDFCEANEIELALFSALVTYKGARFYEDLQAAGRFFETDLAKLNGQYATFHPKSMTSEQLETGLRWLWREFYSKRSVKRRLGRLLSRAPTKIRDKGHASAADLLVALNMAFKVAVRDF